jgi:hypothetical protein
MQAEQMNYCCFREVHTFSGMFGHPKNISSDPLFFFVTWVNPSMLQNQSMFYFILLHFDVLVCIYFINTVFSILWSREYFIKWPCGYNMDIESASIF